MTAPSSAPTSWWRLIRFVAREDGQTYFGQPLDDTLDVGIAYANQDPPIKANVLYTSPLSGPSPLSGVVKTVSTLLPPLLPSEVPTIRALGANFVQPGQNAYDAIKKRPSSRSCSTNPSRRFPGLGRISSSHRVRRGSRITRSNSSLCSVERSKTPHPRKPCMPS